MLNNKNLYELLNAYNFDNCNQKQLMAAKTTKLIGKSPKSRNSFGLDKQRVDSHRLILLTK